jgi:hypothetical protein
MKFSDRTVAPPPNNRTPRTDTPDIFYVASPGGAATLSLARMLSGISPGITCFHGNELYSAEGAGNKGLIEETYRIAKETNTVTGSVHSIFGPYGRRHCLDRGGKVAALFRHPMARALSILRHYDFKNTYIHCPENNFYAKLALQRIKNINVSLKGKYIIADSHNYIARVNFFAVVIRGGLYDALNWRSFSTLEKFRYEDYTQSKESLLSFVYSLLPKKVYREIQSDKIWPIPRLHYRSKLVGDAEVLEFINCEIDFVDLVRRHFIETVTVYKAAQLKEIYLEMGYKF